MEAALGGGHPSWLHANSCPPLCGGVNQNLFTFYSHNAQLSHSRMRFRNAGLGGGRGGGQGCSPVALFNWRSAEHERTCPIDISRLPERQVWHRGQYRPPHQWPTAGPIHRFGAPEAPLQVNPSKLLRVQAAGTFSRFCWFC